MPRDIATASDMSLYTGQGERKYLDQAERARFLKAAGTLECIWQRLFCEVIYFTGCRPSEALNMTERSFSAAESLIIIRSLKKRGRDKDRHFRAVPVPRGFIKRLHAAWTARCTGAAHEREGRRPRRLFTFGRTKAWEIVHDVMARAGITGPCACARGLRHSFGVNAALSGVPESRIKKWLGHSRATTTSIYLDVVGAEERSLAARMWGPQGVPGAAQLIGSDEIIQLVTTYSAIEKPDDRKAVMTTIEACVLTQQSSPPTATTTERTRHG